MTDKNIAAKIVQCLSNDFAVVCELGPGTGILTTPLLQRETIKKLVLIEFDLESVDYLKTHITDERAVIIQADFLKFDLHQIHSSPFALIGNFPYNISSQIFFKVLENRNLVPEVVGMVQKEVGERIASPPGNKTYGILSVLLQSWYDIEYCFTVNENVFFPPPKVKSGVIRLKRNSTQQLDCDEALFFKVVKTAFNQRRKTLRNALRAKFVLKDPENPIFDLRAERLSVDQFVQITNLIETNQL